ncbi:hypothetical protein H0H93_010713 [Arthromyces matolae]|nr:hypothetical protein H0H93_010713 [Arthromyces matolae]
MEQDAETPVPPEPAHIRTMPPLFNTIHKGRPYPFVVLAIPFPRDDILKFGERCGLDLDGLDHLNRVIDAYCEAERLLEGVARSGIVYSATKGRDKSTTAFYFAHNGSEGALNLARNKDTLKRIKEVLGNNPIMQQNPETTPAPFEEPDYIRRMPPLFNTIHKGRPYPFVVLAVPFPRDDILQFAERCDLDLDGMDHLNRVAAAYCEADRLLEGIARSGIVYSATKGRDKSTTAFYFAHNGSEGALNLARNKDTLKRIKEVLGNNREPLWLPLQ